MAPAEKLTGERAEWRDQCQPGDCCLDLDVNVDRVLQEVGDQKRHDIAFDGAPFRT
jgi:hypothetical protein